MFFDPEKLRTARMLRGMRQSDLARESGHTKLTVSRAETGYALPRATTLCDFAAALGVEVRDFFSSEDAQ